jgi:hypothetical protein
MSINRQELKNLIESNGGNDWYKPEEFSSKIQNLLPKELKIVSPPPKYKDNYNCFVFVFGLENDTEFLGGNNPIQQEFIKHLISTNLLVSSTKPEKGNLIFYKNETGEITHGGIMESDDFVVSKWSWGPLFEHKIFDVPSSYGEEVLFFHPIEPSFAKEKYFEYKKTGVEIRPIE